MESQQMQISIRLFAATLAVVFLLAIYFHKSRRDDEPSATAYALMAGFVVMTSVAIMPELSTTFARFFSEVGKLSSLPAPVTVPR